MPRLSHALGLSRCPGRVGGPAAWSSWPPHPRPVAAS